MKYNFNKNSISSIIYALLCMVVATFCYYYLQRNVFTFAIMIFGILGCISQVYKFINCSKKSN